MHYTPAEILISALAGVAENFGIGHREHDRFTNPHGLWVWVDMGAGVGWQ